MATKKYDIVATVGKYNNAAGEEKRRYMNVGAVMQGEHGPYIFLNKTFNPAGVPDERGGESVLLSLFEPKTKDGQQAAPKPAATDPAPATYEDFDNDIPF